MSEPTEDPTPQADPTPDEPLREPGLKALKQERAAREQAEKAAAELQKKLDEIAEQEMSEIQRAQKAAEAEAAAAAEAKAEAEKARAEALRWRIAAKHGISDEDAELFLTGSDEDTLLRQAERLAARETQPSKGTFVPNAGRQPTEPPSLDAQISAAQAEGDTAKVMRLKLAKLSEITKN